VKYPDGRIIENAAVLLLARPKSFLSSSTMGDVLMKSKKIRFASNLDDIA
jgi:hypothetical protein